MSSKYTEAFDSLKSNDETKRERTERILAAQSAATQEKTARTGTLSAAKTRRRFFAGKRGVALLTTIAVFVAAIAVSVPLGISIYNKNGLLNAMAQLKNTFVDMDGIAAFGVWNAPDSSSKSRGISNVSYVKSSSPSAADDFVTTGETGAADIPAEKNDVSDGVLLNNQRTRYSQTRRTGKCRHGICFRRFHLCNVRKRLGMGFLAINKLCTRNGHAERFSLPSRKHADRCHTQCDGKGFCAQRPHSASERAVRGYEPYNAGPSV